MASSGAMLGGFETTIEDTDGCTNDVQASETNLPEVWQAFRLDWPRKPEVPEVFQKREQAVFGACHYEGAGQPEAGVRPAFQSTRKETDVQFKEKALWEKGLANNQNEYGRAIYRYAEAWADLMETLMEAGESLEDIADKASHEADTEGITGFMYGAAVSILSACWEHGEELRRWHNLKTQLNDEGEKANQSGGVLNPALLRVE
jgi:hypothetical protein